MATNKIGVICRLRWNALWIFVIGYLLTKSAFDEHPYQYLLCTLLAFLSCAFLFVRLNEFTVAKAAVWIAFGLYLVLYYVKFYWIVLEPSSLEGFLPDVAQAAFWSPDALISGFWSATASFSAFCICGAIFLFSGRLQNSVNHRSPTLDIETSRRVSKLLLLGLLPLMIGLGILAYTYSIGFLGVEAAPLPFRLAGLVFYSRTLLVPGLLLVLAYFSQRCGEVMMARTAIGLFLLQGVADIFLRSSRGSLLLPLLMLGFLVMVRGYRLRAMERWLAIGTVMLALVLIPLTTEYRWLRVSGVSVESVFDALSRAQTGNWEMFMNGARFVLFRVPGIEGVISAHGLHVEPLGADASAIISSPRGVAGYFTVDIYGINPTALVTYSPSFVGWLYVVGGLIGTLLGSLALAWAVTIGWRRLNRAGLYARPVAQSLALFLLFHAMTEGDLETTAFQLTLSTVVILAIETLVRSIKESARTSSRRRAFVENTIKCPN